MVLLDHRKTYIESLEREARLGPEKSVYKRLHWDEQKKENMMKSAEGLRWAKRAYATAQEQHTDDTGGVPFAIVRSVPFLRVSR